ncbi:MAG TPA: TAXI family TRAP transporter solute-binding subunit [Burkholderiaceae bacterium]|nr:TAXI family TRAP transporter solute-binding subunit [Burkholderiaceae bacterium]
MGRIGSRILGTAALVRAGVAATLVAASVGAAAQQRAPVTISLITAPFGTGSYVLGAALEDIARKNHPWLRVSHAESPGFVFNIRKLDREPELKKTMVVGSGSGVSGLAISGLKPFDKKYPPLKVIANYNLTAVWLATLDPNIKSVKDLNGKKVALGRAPQINWAVQPEWTMRHGWGLDKVNIQYVGTKEAVDALLDGTADAAVVGGYFDPLTKKLELSPQTVEFLASGRRITHLPWGTDAVKKTIAQGMNMAPVTVPANTIQGVGSPMEIFADATAWMVAPEFPEELAYELTKLIINNIKTFGEVHAIGKLMSLDAMAYGWDPKDIHPGALRAYQEAGLLKK